MFGGAAGDPKRADHLGGAGAGLWHADGVAAKDRAGGVLRVDGIHLAQPSAALAVRTRDLMHRDASRGQEPGQSRAERRGALHPGGHVCAEGLRPRQRLLVTDRVGGHRQAAQAPSEPVEGHGDVQVQVGVHAHYDDAGLC